MLRLALGTLVGGPQDGVAGDNLAQRPFDSVAIERAADPIDVASVIDVRVIF